MSQGFKTNSKLTISNPRDRFLRHSKCIEVAIGSTITDISIVIFARLYMKKISLSMDRVQLLQGCRATIKRKLCTNTWSTNPTKWSNILKQCVGKLPMNCLSVFDHFVSLALKGLNIKPTAIYGTYLINLGRIKDWDDLKAPYYF